MTWLAVKLFFGGMMKRLLSALSAVWSFVRRNPWQAAVIALLCLCAGLWWHYTGKLSDSQKIIAAQTRIIAATKEASAANLKAQQAQKTAVEQRYKDLAHDADRNHDLAMADANLALDRYIAAQRVRAEGDDRGGRVASVSAEGVGPGVPRIVPIGSVMVSEEDLRICTANTTYAIDAHEWAMKLEGATVPR